MDVKEAARLGGIARSKKLSKKRRKEIARNAAITRHSKANAARATKKENTKQV